MKTNILGLPVKESELIVKELNILLSNFQVYYQNLRGIHWNIRGKRFFDLHVKFEELYTDSQIKIDLIAERVLTVGGTPLHTFEDYIENNILDQLPLKGNKVLITAGPTYEAIDPVRFIGNHSSGKMGFEIANAAANFGAEVILISGPSHETVSHSLIKLIKVVSASQMYDAVHSHFNSVDIAILSAAVADYKPKTFSDTKIKKKETSFSIELDATSECDSDRTDKLVQVTAVGLNDIKKSSLNLYSYGSGKFKVTGTNFDSNTITVIDLNGRVLSNWNIQENELFIDLSNESKGIYRVAVGTNTFSISNN